MSTPPVLDALPPYIPAPHLLSHSFLTAPQLVSFFHDFYVHLGYTSCAPTAVFERLVANLSEVFTMALQQQRVCHATELKKCHDEIKAFQLSKEKLEKELEESKAEKSIISQKNTSSVSKTSNPLVGTFYIHDSKPAQQQRASWSSVYFSRLYSAPPGLPLGFNRLELDNTDNANVNFYPNNIQKDRFDFHIDTRSNARLRSVSCSWLEIEKNDPDFLFGKFKTMDDHPENKPQMLTSRTVNFKRAYSSPPNVVVWLTAFNLSREKKWRVRTYAREISAANFKIHIETWSDSVLYSATASWIAYPADKPNILSGRFGTWGVRALDPPLHYNSAYLSFGKVFTTIPRIILVVNGVEMDNEHNHGIRIEVKASDVSVAGMTWHINSWAQTAMYGAGVSYIALA